MTISEGAELLCLSERQVQRLKKEVDAEGEVFVLHKNRGRKPRHALSAWVKERVVTLKKKEGYISANFSHFQELLDEHESLSLSRSSVYRVLVAKGLHSPRQHSKKKSHTRRKRTPRRGMLVVMEASPFSWFVDGKAYSLHGAIDDATGEILALFLLPQECLEGYFTLMRTILSRYGLPLAGYVDQHTIFRSPKEGKLSLEEELSGKRVKESQFGRAMEEPGITLIWAKSPQAKGNIEKLWDTRQSRLPVELKINGVTTPEEANAFLATFIE